MSELYGFFTTLPWVTAITAVVVAVLLLYMGRRSAHKAIKGVFHILYSSLRLGARSVSLAEQRLKVRNREVLMTLGRENAERELHREFFRINKFVERDLGGYPELQRQIQEQVTQINEDYQNSGEVPPPSPEWIKAVESVAQLNLKENGNNLTAQILEDIHHSAEEQHNEALQAYRHSVADRHARLKHMAPYWRRLANSIDHVGSHLKELVTRSKNIDRQMDQFEEINRGTDRAERTLKASTMTQFCIALIFILFAVGGAFFNFHLIALPMSEMVGAAARVGGVKVADVAALVIIFLEITMGMFLLEALQWTRLFPIIGSMDDKVRVRLAWICGIILLTLAGVESGLAFMRDQIASEFAALRASLSNTEALASESMISEWIPRVTGMFLGFTVPLALTLVAIPLEYLMHTGRIVVGMVMEYILRLIAISMRIVGNGSRHVGGLFINLYDLVIMLPLWIETTLIKGRRGSAEDGDSNDYSTSSKSRDYYPREVSKNA